MRIAFLTIGSFDRFASAKRSLGMGEALACMGHEVYILSLDCLENRRRLEEEAGHCRCRFFNSGNAFQEAMSKIGILREVRPDLVYSNSYCVRNLAGFRMFLPKCQIVLEFNELYSSYGSHSFLWKIIERVAICAADKLVCASNYLAEHIKALTKKPVLYLPYAYSEYLSRSVSAKTTVKRIVFMASLWKEYGVYDVIEAVRLIVAAGREVVLDIIGRGPELENVKKLCAEAPLNFIHIHGYVSEEKLGAFFSSASVFVSPLMDTVQDRARCPSKIYYYIPFCKPIVTCGFGDPYDALGDNGFYYISGDVKDMARAIVKALACADRFSYPDGFVKQHSWHCRAVKFEGWVNA